MTDRTCPCCHETMTPAVYGRHRGSKACAVATRIHEAVKSLVGFDVVYGRAKVTIQGTEVRVLAVGLDRDLQALTVVDMNGNVRQYVAGEWSAPAERRMWGWLDKRRADNIGGWIHA